MKHFLSLLIVALLATSVTACGPVGEEPDIDEGLHIAADDAQQRIDRDDGEDTHTDVQGENDSNFDDDEDDEDSETYPTPDADEEGSEPQGPDWQYTTDADPEPEPADNTNTGTDQSDFWIDDCTYDLIGYAKAIGCKVGYGSIADPKDPTQLNYCKLEFSTGKDGDTRYMTIFSPCHDANKNLSPYMTGWQVLNDGGASGVNSYLDGNILESDDDPVSMVYIQNSNYWMPAAHLPATLTIIERIAADDPECWFRGLGIYHGGQSMHDD